MRGLDRKKFGNIVQQPDRDCMDTQVPLKFNIRKTILEIMAFLGKRVPGNTQRGGNFQDSEREIENRGVAVESGGSSTGDMKQMKSSTYFIPGFISFNLRRATVASMMLPWMPAAVARPSTATCCMYMKIFQKMHNFFLCWGIIGEFL